MRSQKHTQAEKSAAIEPVAESREELSVDAFTRAGTREKKHSCFKRIADFAKMSVLVGALATAISCSAGKTEANDNAATSDSVVFFDKDNTQQDENRPDETTINDNVIAPDEATDEEVQDDGGPQPELELDVDDESIPVEDEQPDADEAVSDSDYIPNPTCKEEISNIATKDWCGTGYSDGYINPARVGISPFYKITAYVERLNGVTIPDCDRMLGNVTHNITDDEHYSQFRWPFRATDPPESEPFQLLYATFPKAVLECMQKPGSVCDNYVRLIDPYTAVCDEGVNYSVLHVRRLYYYNADPYQKVLEGVLCQAGAMSFTDSEAGKVVPLKDGSGRSIRADSVSYEGITQGGSSISFSLLDKNGAVLKSVSHDHADSSKDSDVAINDIILEGFDSTSASNYKYVVKMEGFAPGKGVSLCIENYPWKIYALRQGADWQVNAYDLEGRPIRIGINFYGDFDLTNRYIMNRGLSFVVYDE